ncbi:SIR2 family NAD-dependent protein deacylase [Dyadobacter tibetensis]|uniref:SIR2 family NAD-dependent protein deacylase n=1 Tax=Dyadobacter tibetensis TaxID=1211851 RepID=UPI000471323B|nr:NAD-dependent deacylase [Dyadobacter tibetensis]
MKKIVVLSGAGISAESGISTFRDQNGLWENYRIEEVATPEAWARDPALVLQFYNQRRKNALEVVPNSAHLALAELEKHFNVQIITQNIDNLHERAGSTQVLHLHGELFRSRSSIDPKITYPIEGWELNIGDTSEDGSQLRPDIVWFGEAVPKMEEAIPHVEEADILIIIGTSLVVYPAAGLIHYAPKKASIFLVDPKLPEIRTRPNYHLIEEKATVGMQIVTNILLEAYN